MKNKYIFLLISLSFNLNTFAQKNNDTLQKLQGVITNHYGFPVLNATITVLGNDKLYQTNSDSNGNYCLATLNNGLYEIIVKAENYARTVSQVFYDNGIFKIQFRDFRLYGNLNKNIKRFGSCYSSWIMSKPLNPILKAPNQNINSIAAYMRGVDSRNGEIPSINGARPENTAYYFDGVRIVGMEENYASFVK